MAITLYWGSGSPFVLTAWAAHLGWLKLERPLALIDALPSVAILRCSRL
jgi:hypothetical protein